MLALEVAHQLRGEESRAATRWVPVAATIGPVAVLAAHFLAIPPLPAGGAAPGIGIWLNGGPATFAAAMRFGWADVAATGFPREVWPPILVPVAAVVAAALAWPRWRAAGLLAAMVLPILFLLVIGQESLYYWGAFYTPLAVAVAPGVLGRIMPARTASDAPVAFP